LGIFLLHERPEPAEFAGMAAILVAVFLLTTSQVKARSQTIEALEEMPGESPTLAFAYFSNSTDTADAMPITENTIPMYQ